MKNLLSLLALVWLLASPAFAQHECNFGYLIEKQLHENPSYAQDMLQLDQEIRTYMQQNPNMGNNRVVRTISVAVHVVYNTTAENVSTTSINNLIATLNADYRRTNADATQTRSAFLSVAADAQIEFCLDTIIRRSTTKTCFDPDTESNQMKSNSTNGSTPLDPRYYLNIWIVDLCGNTGGGVAGYAYLPTTGVPGSSIDGLVIDYSLGYDNGTGRTATHEIGHYLGLPHVWGSDSNPSCSTDDGFTDTPNTDGPNYACSATNSCSTPSPGDQYENYMDYSSCPNMFTTQQVNYMNSILTQRRSSLFSSPGCNSTVANIPSADFIGNPTTVAVGGSVAFTDQSTNSPTAWSWTFTGGTPGTSTAQNPTITYNTAGTYTVSLTATNASGTDTETKVAYITVVPAAGGCDTVDIFTSTDSFAIYYAPGGTGYLSGHNSYGDLAKANRYTPLVAGSTVTGAFIRFGVAKTSNNRTVNVRVWDSNGTSGAPGTVLATQVVPISSLSTTNYTYIGFTTPPTVTGNYYVGVEYAYASGDTIAIVTNTPYSGNANVAWEKWDDNTWHPFTDYWGVSMKHIIFPIECTPGGNLPDANFTASATAVCAGGSITFTNTSTNATSYAWTFQGGTPGTSTATSPTVTYGTAGTYSVTLVATGSNGVDTETRTNYITVRSKPVPTATATNVSCNGGNNGTITLGVTGGTPNYTYLWNGGVNTQNRTNLPAGTYTVTVTDANGCTGTTSATITQPSTPFTVSLTNTAASCAGNNGTATVTPSGGAAPYTYLWSTNATTQSISGLAPGTYTVTVTSTGGCTATGSTVVGGATNNITLSTTTTPATCGQSNGSVTLTRTGGTGTITYTWSNGRTTQNLTGVSAGSYTVTVTDGNGCNATTTATVTSTGGPTASIVSTTNVTCFGGSNGSLTAAGNGGSGSYTYAWSNGGGGATKSNLAAGTYTVTVTDGNGCITTTTGTVTQPNQVVASVGSQTNVSCFGGTNGSATITATGGNGSYFFNWGSFTGATRTNLAAGTYAVSTVDGNGCVGATIPVTITEPTQLASTVTSVNPGCTAANGSATVTAAGGTTPYNYAWSNGTASATASGLVAGTYSVTVTDAKGCTTTQSVTLVATTGPSVTTSSSSVGCNGTQDGTATAAVSGGTPPYTYAWNDANSQTTQTATNLQGGTYTVTVTDAAGCSLTSTVAVSNIGPKIAETVADVSGCFGNNNGSISLNVTGGNPPYTYAWNNAQTTQNIINLTGGIYTITVTDNGGCQTVKAITVNQPSEVQATIQTTPSAQGQSTGTASVTASGGNPPYTYAWSTGTTGSSVGNLGAGSHVVTVTDANGCANQFNLTITVGTAVANVDASIGVEIYPNPNTGRFVVNVSNTTSAETHVEVYNTLGQKVFVSGLKMSNVNEFEIDLSNMPANTYFVKVVSGNESVVRKVLRIN